MSGARVGIRTIVVSTTIAIVAIAVLAFGIVSERSTRKALTEEAEARLLLEARNLALASAGALLSELPELTLHPVVRELAESRRELAFAVVTDHRGFVQGHKDARALGRSWQLPGGLAPLAGAPRLRADEALLGSRLLIVARVPVASANGQRLGTVVVGLRRAYVDGQVEAARRQQALVVALVLAFGVAVAFLVLTALLRPIGALREGLDRIGRGDLDTPIALRDRTELGLLADTVDGMAARLKVAQHDILEKQRLEHEVRLARDIQQRLLSTRPEVRGEFTLTSGHRPAAEVGGDYVDVLPLAGGRVALAIGDVAGKGLGGCLVMTMLAAALRALRGEHRSPAGLLVALEEQLASTLKPGEFVTLFYGALDPATGVLTYASAGHTPLLLWRSAERRAEWHSTRGIPLGALRGGRLRATLEDHQVVIEPGDLMFQFTDGYNEAENARGEAFGFDRIVEVVAGHAAEGPQAVIAALGDAMKAWSAGAAPQDDQTVLAVSRAARAAGSVPGAAGLDAADPVARVRAAEATGHGLALPSSLDALESIGPWLAALPEVGRLQPSERILIETALHELCANVVEHGASGEDSESLDLWWMPSPVAVEAATAAAVVARGHFVLRDRGYPFRPGRRRPFDPSSHTAWSRGRGLGLDIVHLVVSEVVFRPGTAEGNVTLLSIDPERARRASEERQHG